MSQCRQLINSGDSNIEKYVRKGDIYAVMIQHSLNAGDTAEVKQLLVEMKQYLATTNVSLTYYLSSDVIQLLAKTLGIPLSSLLPQKNISENSPEENEQEIQEEVDDA